jgi:hypothetical protein
MKVVPTHRNPRFLPEPRTKTADAVEKSPSTARRSLLEHRFFQQHRSNSIHGAASPSGPYGD